MTRAFMLVKYAKKRSDKIMIYYLSCLDSYNKYNSAHVFLSVVFFMIFSFFIVYFKKNSIQLGKKLKDYFQYY